MVRESGPDLDIPRGPALLDEHPTEAACRIAADVSGFDVYFTFRKLAEAPSGAARYIYQTSPEVELPDEFVRPDSATGENHRFFWVNEKAAPALLPEDLAPGFRRMLHTPD